MPVNDLLFRIARPVLSWLPPEGARRLTVQSLRAGLAAGRRAADPPELAVSLWGLAFPNPLGIAAGADKDGQIVRPLLRLGAGFVEVGTVTPRPQPGNPRPRILRVPERDAVINRMGMPGTGAQAVAARLRRLRAGPPLAGPVGVNIGRNARTDDEIEDYASGVRAFGALADFLVLNVSSPNTKGLRALQQAERLETLVRASQAARRAIGGGPPLLVKIAPDLEPAEEEAIAEVVLRTGIDGLVVSNTTVDRSGLPDRYRDEAGGLSGPPLMERSTALLARMARLTGRAVPLVGVGGVASGADAYAKIRAGATLVQLYTALIHRGPGLIERIKSELAASLRRDGFRRVGEAVGADLG